MDHSSTNPQQTLVVLFGKLGTASCALRDGESILVGSAPGCQLRIEDHAIARHQCLVELRAGNLILHNWCASCSTTVNGEPVDADAVIGVNDVVEFGGYGLKFDAVSMVGASPTIPVDATADPGAVFAEVFSQRESQRKTEREVNQILVTPAVSTTRSKATSLLEAESVETSTINLLHSEIAFLQNELDDREAKIAELIAAAQAEAAFSDKPAEASSASSSRIADLLFELQLSDERISNLEHEVRIIEDLRMSELDEKQQIESWVSEIEKRIAKREAETEAGIEVLAARLEREKAARLASQLQADENLCAGSNSSQVNDAFKVLRHDHESLREKYQQLADRYSELERQNAELIAANTQAAIQEQVDEALRLARLELAQERAAISRREHEIATKLKEMEAQLRNQSRVNEADARFQVFRERLQELHLQEQAEYKPPSIGQRLLKMWHSLDGPTDVD